MIADIALDLVCVHCYRAFVRLRRAADRHRADGTEMRIVVHPHQLRPDAPVPGERLFDVHRRDRGEEAALAIAADRTLGAADGLTIDLGRAVLGNTLDAHTAVAVAAEHGLAQAYVETMFAAYFGAGVDLSDRNELARLAAGTGFTLPTIDAAMTADTLAALHRTATWLDGRATPIVRVGSGPDLVGERSTAEYVAAIRAALRAC